MPRALAGAGGSMGGFGIDRYITNYYRRIPKVTAPVTFEFCRQKGPLLSGSRDLLVAVIFGEAKKKFVTRNGLRQTGQVLRYEI